MQPPTRTAQRWIDAMRAGASRASLAAPGFRYAGTPFAGLVTPIEPTTTPDEAGERMGDAGITLRFGELREGAPDRAWVEVVWSHDAPTGHGSAGLQWVVFTVEDDLVSEIRFFGECEPARRYAERDGRPA